MRSYQTSDNQRGRSTSGNAAPQRNARRPQNNRTAQPAPPPPPQPINEQKKPPKNVINEPTPNPSGLIKSIMNFIPPGVYNRETKKLFGFITAEDLLLAALILMLADSDDNEDTALLIALVYILLG